MHSSHTDTAAGSASPDKHADRSGEAFTPVPVWAWWAGRNEEWLTIGPEQTRDDVVAAAISDIGVGEGCFHVMEAVMQTLPPLDAESIIDSYFEDIADAFQYFSSESDSPAWEVSKDQQAQATAELQVALNTWFEKWQPTMPAPNMFAETRNCEIVSNTVDPDMLPGGHDNPRGEA